MFFVLCLTFVCPSFALEEVSSGDYAFTDEDIELINEQVDSLSFGDISIEDVQSDSPLPVTIVDDEAVYPSLYASSAPALVIGDTPPINSPFYGSGWITGHSSTLGTVTLYFPIDYSHGHWGVDSDGYLFNVTSSSMSGYLDGVRNNSVSAPAFSYPRYRNSSSDYITLYLKPTDSNMDIATSHQPKFSVDDILPYVMISCLGVVILCFMKRS